MKGRLTLRRGRSAGRSCLPARFSSPQDDNLGLWKSNVSRVYVYVRGWVGVGACPAVGSMKPSRIPRRPGRTLFSVRYSRSDSRSGSRYSSVQRISSTTSTQSFAWPGFGNYVWG